MSQVTMEHLEINDLGILGISENDVENHPYYWVKQFYGQLISFGYIFCYMNIMEYLLTGYQELFLKGIWDWKWCSSVKKTFKNKNIRTLGYIENIENIFSNISNVGWRGLGIEPLKTSWCVCGSQMQGPPRRRWGWHFSMSSLHSTELSRQCLRQLMDQPTRLLGFSVTCSFLRLHTNNFFRMWDNPTWLRKPLVPD